MTGEIIGLHHWFDTAPGRYLLAWEQERYDELVADIFGYHALQLGMPGLQALRSNRMPHRWLAVMPPELLVERSDAQEPPALLADAVALPFAEASLDLLALPHTLELSVDPHTALREVHRVLVPEGKVVISGLNPLSLWGLRQRRSRLYQRCGAGGRLFLPDVGEFISPGRLRDWLRLLGFELESMSFGCYRPAVAGDRWLQRYGWMDALGARWWPIFGAAYVIVAVKRVQGMRLLEPSWRKAPQAAAAQVQVARRHGPG
ncbi:methyltransferase domain-containing protein [Diaphorobacter sp. LR2014-1]|uniref:class I SAM-dependent methyltransferase n=1 Tax=Diaphorobacter sp. LR2014-1 TaxID=1933219 RepID=UPI000CDA540D|nr:methyltransferase domain-containing protein [Diaphorobacter sp. LR2014-1]POR06930.1 SAM-dependent methyltransferase [Diaphorobacter sp. LR2014-1]